MMPQTDHSSCLHRLLYGRDDVLVVLLHDLDVDFLIWKTGLLFIATAIANRRVLFAIFVASKEWLGVAAVAGRGKPGPFRVAPDLASGGQRPGVRGL